RHSRRQHHDPPPRHRVRREAVGLLRSWGSRAQQDPQGRFEPDRGVPHDRRRAEALCRAAESGEEYYPRVEGLADFGAVSECGGYRAASGVAGVVNLVPLAHACPEVVEGYSWARVRVRVISDFDGRSRFKITLTPALSH